MTKPFETLQDIDLSIAIIQNFIVQHPNRATEILPMIQDARERLTATADQMELVKKKKCICVDFLNNNPDPVPNPDCPIHGALSTEDK